MKTLLALCLFLLMPTPPPMNDEALFASIADQLEPAVASLGGVFSRAQDPFQVMELLGQGPGMRRVILHDDGEDKAGDRDPCAVALHRYKVTVSGNRGMFGLLGQSVTLGDAKTSSLLAFVSAVRDALRGFTFPPGLTSERLFYQGRNTVSYEGARLDAYELSFTLFAALPAAS